MTTIAGFSLLSQVNTSYNGFFFVSLKSWDERKSPQEQVNAIMMRANEALSKIPDGIAFGFPPPAIPGIGTSGGVVAVLEDLAGMPVRISCGAYAEIHRSGPEASGSRSDPHHLVAKRSSTFPFCGSRQSPEARS